MKKDLDWANIGFGYRPTDYRFVANYKNGAWDEGALTTDATVTLSESVEYVWSCCTVPSTDTTTCAISVLSGSEPDTFA